MPKPDLRHITATGLHPLAVPLESISRDPQNERAHPRENIDRIKYALRRFGVRGALSLRPGELVTKGNGTHLALTELAEEKASGLWKGADPDEPLAWGHVPVLEFDDDDEAAAEYRVLDNRAGDNAGWERGALETSFEAFPDVDWSKSWTEEELADEFEGWGGGASGDGNDDAGAGGDPPDGTSDENKEPPIPEVPAEPVTKLGEVIEIGPHVIHCADCMDVMRGLADNSVDAIVTDPPYGLSPDGRARTWDDLDDLRRLRHQCQDRCPTHVLGLADIGDTDDADPEAEQECVSIRVRLSLRVVSLAAVKLDDGRQGWEVEVDGDRAVGHVEDLLVREWDLALREELAKGQLGLRVMEGLPGCVGACSCATECSHPFGGVLVGLRHDALGEAQGAAGVVAGAGAELRAVLRFHAGGRSADLFPARGTDDVDAALLLGASELVGAGPAARGLPAVPEPDRLSEVGDGAGGTLSFDLLTAGVLVDNSTHDPSLTKKGFMGQSWDAGVPGLAWARECLRVLKPGGYIVAFSATRTVHRLACAIEDAGFEIRDQIGWLTWQGFPKSLDVSKAIDGHHGVERETVRTPMGPTGNKTWSGWGTALKPSIEPAVLARKPLSEKTVAANVLKWGTGALNIDACRYAYGDKAWPGPQERVSDIGRGTSTLHGPHSGPVETVQMSDLGRWPANIYHCPKPATRERNEGCDALPQVEKAQLQGATDPNDPVSERFRSKPMGNVHATVKPRRLFTWLLRLVTPPGGTVLEPFGGSGTTLVSAAGLDCKVIVAELSPAYCDIIRARGEHSIR